VRFAQEIFGPTHVRGQETRAQQAWSSFDREPIELLAESIAGEIERGDASVTSNRRGEKRLAAVDQLWASWR